MSKSEYSRLSKQMPEVFKVIRDAALDLAINAINSESVITNPRARKNAVQAIMELKHD